MFNLVSGLSGFAGEFANETDRIRQENQHPKVKASAITALLTPKGTGGSGLSKWFNQQQSHPIFDQVHQLISGEGPGGQPSGIGPAYLDPGEKERVQTEGRASGAESGTFAGIERAGITLTPEQKVQIAQARAGGPQRAPVVKIVTLEVADPDNPGKTKHIGATEINGVYYQQNPDDPSGSHIPVQSQILNVLPAGYKPPTTSPYQGSALIKYEDPQHPGQFLERRATPEELARGVSTVGPPPPPYVAFPNAAGGGQLVNPRPGPGLGTSVPIQGNVGPAESPAAHFASLRQMVNDANARAERRTFRPGGLPADEAELQAARDVEARLLGRKDWTTLVKEMADAGATIEQRVQPQRSDEGGPPPPGLPTKATAPGKTPPAKPVSEVDKIRAALAAPQKKKPGPVSTKPQ